MTGVQTCALPICPDAPAVHQLRLSVRDSGIGIAPDEQALVFERFGRARAVASRIGGAGLGLAIVRELARLMGGDVTLLSTPGQGSTFTVSLPLEALPLPARAAAAAPVAPPDLLRGRHLLVVDDSQANLDVAAALLRAEGARVQTAADGLIALALIEQCQRGPDPFDAVLMDLQMPGLDGEDTTRRLRLQPALRHLPVVAMTAAATRSDQARALASGMDGFITKPFRLDTLRDALFPLLGRSPHAGAPAPAPAQIGRAHV